MFFMWGMSILFCLLCLYEQAKTEGHNENLSAFCVADDFFEN